MTQFHFRGTRWKLMDLLSYIHSSTQNHIRSFLGATVKIRIWLLALGHILPRVLGLVTWHRHVTIRTTPSQLHVFVCRPECVNDSLVLGIVVKQIAQCKEGMFPQV